MKMSSTKPPQKGGLKSKIICKYFIQGKCIKGENCPYLHSQIEKPKEMLTVECPMYNVGFCKNGQVCHFLHIKKDKFVEEELEEKNTTSTTPIAEENNITNNNINNTNNINDLNENNLNIEKNGEKKENNENNDNNKENRNYPPLPIWYLEHFYDKPLSLIFSELEQKNLPEIAELKKKYGFINIEPNLPVIQPINKKNKTNLNMNTLNLNLNNFNMNLAFNNNHNDINNNKNNIIQNPMQLNQINQINQINNDIKFDAYKLKKDSIEYLINKEDNIFYYLIRCKNYDEIKKSLELNKIELPEELFNKYKNTDLKTNKLTVIIFIFDDECENFAGFAKLKYPLIQKNTDSNEEKENENEQKLYLNCYKIEWLWRTKLHYSKIRHLLNRADNDHFLNEGKNGCPIDKDLGNYCCRLMIKRLSKDEVQELINEKKMFENQRNLLQNLKKEEYNNSSNINLNNNKYNNNYNNNDSYKNYDYSDKKYKNKYYEKSPFKYSNNKNYLNDINSNRYKNNNKNDFKYSGHKKYRNNSKSRSRNRRSDSEDYSYSNSYKNKRIKNDDYKYDYNKNKNYHKKDYKDYNYNRRYINDDNKSTDFSSKKSFH